MPNYRKMTDFAQWKIVFKNLLIYRGKDYLYRVLVWAYTVTSSAINSSRALQVTMAKVNNKECNEAAVVDLDDDADDLQN